MERIWHGGWMSMGYFSIRHYIIASNGFCSRSCSTPKSILWTSPIGLRSWFTILQITLSIVDQIHNASNFQILRQSINFWKSSHKMNYYQHSTEMSFIRYAMAKWKIVKVFLQMLSFIRTVIKMQCLQRWGSKALLSYWTRSCQNVIFRMHHPRQHAFVVFQPHPRSIHSHLSIL